MYHYITSYVCCGVLHCRQEESPLPGWTTQPSVPNCIVSHLTFIQFKGFKGVPDELLFAEYILQKGLVLKTMIIDDISVDLSKKYDILNKLSKVRRDGIFPLIFD
ncbi:putative FBD domain-containing protein [Medicago truncatula]|uniref:FBD protein n=1 Tax=Medicago truncatula TaxID=3880 RepID=G7LGM1_MEDTR|nr:FBD protein [Medicago truncatula]RHN39130.1 putative FBD domain-containing protein [Medicago truncatula]